MHTSASAHPAAATGPRLFVSVALPAAAQDAVAATTAGLRAAGGTSVRWSDPAAVHLTLRFLGTTPEDRVAPLQAALADAAGRVVPFTMDVAGAGAFPTPARPRVLWLGVAPNPALAALYHAVDDACAAAALGREPRPFRAHLTVGRPRPGAPRLDGQLASVGFVAAVHVDSFHLMASDLSRTGARHTRVASFPLRGGTAAPPGAGPR